MSHPSRSNAPSAFPWHLTVTGEHNGEYSYRTRDEAWRWAISFIKKHNSVEFHKYEKRQWVKRELPPELIDWAKKKAY